MSEQEIIERVKNEKIRQEIKRRKEEEFLN